MISKLLYVILSRWSWIILGMYAWGGLCGQEIRTGLEYKYNAWKGADLGIGMEFRKHNSLPLPPDEILLKGKVSYRALPHWKVGCTFRGTLQQNKFETENVHMKDRIRITLDTYYFKKHKERKSTFQIRLRYQLSEDEGNCDHYARFRMKWKQKSFKSFCPYASTEIIYSGIYPQPDACRIRIGMETRLNATTGIDAFYQAAIRLKRKHEIMQFALGATIQFESQ